MNEPRIRIGQVWREVDPRQHRLARILLIAGEGRRRRSIQIRTVVMAGDGSAKDPHRWGDRERFNGKRGGYELYEDVP